MLLQRGWLRPQAEAGRQVCPDLAQTAKARPPAVAQPVPVSFRATVGRQACLVQMVKLKQLLEISRVLPLRAVVLDQVCLWDLAKLAAQPRQATLDSPRLLLRGCRARVLQLRWAAERSLDFQS
jgi:hypothetical protein